MQCRPPEAMGASMLLQYFSGRPQPARISLLSTSFYHLKGGKQHGKNLEIQKDKLDAINEELITEDALKEIENGEQKLVELRDKFMGYDKNMDGLIDVMDLKRVLEDLGQAKTHKQVVAMIREIDKEHKDAISYREFVDMMLGTRKSVLRMILLFESKAKGTNDEEKPSGPPPKKTITDLP